MQTQRFQVSVPARAEPMVGDSLPMGSLQPAPGVACQPGEGWALGLAALGNRQGLCPMNGQGLCPKKKAGLVYPKKQAGSVP